MQLELRCCGLRVSNCSAAGLNCPHASCLSRDIEPKVVRDAPHVPLMKSLQSINAHVGALKGILGNKERERVLPGINIAEAELTAE